MSSCAFTRAVGFCSNWRAAWSWGLMGSIASFRSMPIEPGLIPHGEDVNPVALPRVNEPKFGSDLQRVVGRARSQSLHVLRVGDQGEESRLGPRRVLDDLPF